MNHELILSSMEAVAQGSERAVYFHPDHPDVVFKVVVGKDIDPRSRKFEHIALWVSPNKLMMRRSRKELHSYILSKFAHHQSDCIFPAAEMRGFYESDIGLAVAFERITDGSNALGPTLGKIAETGGLTPNSIKLLNEFVQRILEWNLIASDLNLSNIVFGRRGGIEQFVLIDGMGAPHLVPMRYWSRRFNRRELIANIKKIEVRLNGIQKDCVVKFNDDLCIFKILSDNKTDMTHRDGQ